MCRKLLHTAPFVVLVLSLSAMGKSPGVEKGKRWAQFGEKVRRVPTAEQVEGRRAERRLRNKIEARIEREVRAARESQNMREMDNFRKTRQSKSETSERTKLRRRLEKSARWQRFAHPGKFPNDGERFKMLSVQSGPTVLINGVGSDTIDAGEPFEVSITFSAGSGDSASIDVLFDADKDGIVDAGDISLLSILFFDDGGPGRPEWVFDNSMEDEDPTEGVFVVTVDDFPYMGISVILEATEPNIGSGQALLTINDLTGDYTASGTVTPVTAPALVFFSHEFEDEPFMTFTDESGAFSFGFLDRGEGFRLGAMDVVLGMDTGGYLFLGKGYKDPEELSNVTIDITRDAEASGTVVDEQGVGIEDAWVDIFSEGFYEMLAGFATSDTSGAFILPLQGGHLYSGVWSDHPSYMGDMCTDYPIYVQTGDEIDVSCVLEPWPAFVEGYVTDSETGEPVDDIEVNISFWNERDPSDNGMWNNTWTDIDGYYRLGSIMGEGELCAFDWEWREYQDYCIRPFTVDQALVSQDISMDPYDGAIEGVVSDASTGLPVGGADVWIPSEDSDVFQKDITNEQGEYLLPAMNGTYTVCASKWWEGYDETCVENITISDDTVAQDIALEPPDGFIQGYVYDAETGDAIPGIAVEAFGETEGRMSHTDEEGFFRIGVHNGTYEVCYFDWTNTYETDDLCVSDVVVLDNTVDIADMNLIPIVWDGAMEGKVADQYGNPVVAWIGAFDTLSWEGNRTVTDMNGEYFLPLNNGNYVAIAEPLHWGYLPDIELGIAISNDTTAVDFVTLVVQIDAMVRGTVTDTLGNPLDSAFVAVEGRGNSFEWGPHFETETDANGDYALGVMGFDDRDYFVYADYWDEAASEWLAGGLDSVSVGSGDTVTADLTLVPVIYTSTISGHVSREGEPVMGAEVSALNLTTDELFVTNTDEEGFYTMGVTNGEYDVCAHIWGMEHAICEYVSLFDEDAVVDFDFGPPRPAVEFVPNEHGNFRFSWNNYGEMTHWDYREDIPLGPNGEWPAESGKHYLFHGGLLVSGFTDDERMVMGGVYSDGWMPTKKGIHVEFADGFEVIARHMADEGGWMPTGLKANELIVAQENKDVVVIGTRVRYDGPGTMINVRAGYFLDWDLAYSDSTGDETEYWLDDLAGSIEVSISDPVHGTTIPAKLSYMVDDDGDGGASPGYVGMATLYEPGLGGTHISLSAAETPTGWFPSEVEFMSLLQSETDSPDETTPADYRVLQSSNAVDLSTGDVLGFVTVLMAADALDQFSGLLQDAWETVISHLEDFTVSIAKSEMPFPHEYVLHQNHPNPFNPVTTIRYELPKISDVRLTVYDMLGREVAVLVNRRQPPGSYATAWSGKDQFGRDVATGIYIYQLRAGDFVSTRKFILLK